jgi:NAD(P)-dependent dehydrogenase (short-subunit alcohol dehydrogenase family)
MRLKPVEEQVVALMGASSGIGRETALRFANRGAKVVVSARNEKGLNSLVEEIRGKGGQATAIPAEVTEFEQVKAVADRAVEVYRRLDTWVHLAAVHQPGIVSQAILHAAENPARDLVVGGAAKAVILSQTLSPRLLDILLKFRGFEVHYTSEPKPEDAPDNLFEPIDGYNTVEGSFRERAHPRSLYNWLQLHPTVKRGAVAGMAIGALGALRRRM